MSNPRLMGGWALAQGRNATERYNRNNNLRAGRSLTRVMIEHPHDRSGDFDPDATNVLLQGVTYREHRALCEQFGLEVSLCIGMTFENGREDGRNYHWAVTRDGEPILDPPTNKRFLRQVIRFYQRKNVPIWAVEIDNEASYQRSMEGTWGDYLSAYRWNALQMRNVVRQMLGPDVWVISGGQHPGPEHQGRETINGYLFRKGDWHQVDSRSAYCYHGNGRNNDQMRDELESMREWLGQDAPIAMNEDNPESGFNYLSSRVAIAAEYDLICAGFFDCRNVNINSEQGCCSWSVDGGCDAPRWGIAIEGCDGDWHDDNWQEFKRASEWLGEWDDSIEILPVNVDDGPPVDPPNDGPPPLGYNKMIRFLEDQTEEKYREWAVRVGIIP